MSQTQARAKPESAKVQVEERAPRNLVLSPNSFFTLYLTIFYVQITESILQRTIFLLNWDPFWRGYRGPFTGGTDTLWAHESRARLHLNLPLQTDLEAWWRLIIVGGGGSLSDKRPRVGTGVNRPPLASSTVHLFGKSWWSIRVQWSRFCCG